MKLTDLSNLSSLLTDEERQKLAVEDQQKKAKRKIGEGQDVKVTLDTKARRGKSVTLISDLHLSTEMRDKLAKELKQLLSAGGTAEQDTIVIQGDHRSRVIEHLQKNGFTVRQK